MLRGQVKGAFQYFCRKKTGNVTHHKAFTGECVADRYAKKAGAFGLHAETWSFNIGPVNQRALERSPALKPPWLASQTFLLGFYFTVTQKTALSLQPVAVKPVLLQHMENILQPESKISKLFGNLTLINMPFYSFVLGRILESRPSCQTQLDPAACGNTPLFLDSEAFSKKPDETQAGEKVSDKFSSRSR